MYTHTYPQTHPHIYTHTYTLTGPNQPGWAAWAALIQYRVDGLGGAHWFINGFGMLLLMFCFKKLTWRHTYQHAYIHAYTPTCIPTCIPTYIPTHSLYMNLYWQGHREIKKIKKTLICQSRSIGPSKTQNERSNTRSMDLDGHMVLSINVICFCVCFDKIKSENLVIDKNGHKHKFQKKNRDMPHHRIHRKLIAFQYICVTINKSPPQAGKLS